MLKINPSFLLDIAPHFFIAGNSIGCFIFWLPHIMLLLKSYYIPHCEVYTCSDKITCVQMYTCSSDSDDGCSVNEIVSSRKVGEYLATQTYIQNINM